MSAVIVHTKEQLKAAIDSGAAHILVKDEDLAKRLWAIQLIKKRGPIAVAGVIAAIPVIVATGGIGAAPLAVILGAAGVAALPSIAWIAAICGAVILMSLFSDWELVKVGGFLELKRNQKKAE